MPHILAISFSPTGNTHQVVSNIATVLSQSLHFTVKTIDWTKPNRRMQPLKCSAEDIIVFGCPTYAGKVPNKLLNNFQNLFGNQAKTIAVVTYGNRHFDNALAHLHQLLTNQQFSVIAMGAFVAEHTFTPLLGTGRPNANDKAEIQKFATRIAEKISRLSPLPLAKIPGDANAPYYTPKGEDGNPVQFLKATPKTNLAKCTHCMLCTHVCPMASIDAKNPAHIIGICIKCQACVKGCPTHAKFFDDPLFLSHVRMLEQSFQTPKENWIILDET